MTLSPSYFHEIGNLGAWWTSSKNTKSYGYSNFAFCYELINEESIIFGFVGDGRLKGSGLSVRCIKGPGVVLDDGIPKSPTGNDINLQLMDTRTRLFVQNSDFVSAIQKSINKASNDYSSNNIFK
jgi:hypothetical protein